MFRKLQWLRDEEKDQNKGVVFKKKFMEDFSKEDMNFFLEDLAECEMDEEGRLGDDETTQAIMQKEQARHAKLEE
jgi:hypothetical protein